MSAWRSGGREASAKQSPQIVYRCRRGPRSSPRKSFIDAGGGSRTLMVSPPRDFESRASTSFATPAQPTTSFPLPFSRARFQQKPSGNEIPANRSQSQASRRRRSPGAFSGLARAGRHPPRCSAAWPKCHPLHNHLNRQHFSRLTKRMAPRMGASQPQAHVN